MYFLSLLNKYALFQALTVYVSGYVQIYGSVHKSQRFGPKKKKEKKRLDIRVYELEGDHRWHSKEKMKLKHTSMNLSMEAKGVEGIGGGDEG